MYVSLRGSVTTEAIFLKLKRLLHFVRNDTYKAFFAMTLMIATPTHADITEGLVKQWTFDRSLTTMTSAVQVAENDPSLKGSLDGMSSFTIAAWVKLNQGGTAFTIASKRHSGAPWYSYNFSVGANNKVNFAMNTVSGSGTAGGSIVLPIGQWVHVAAVYNGAKIIMYVNGLEDKNGWANSFTGAVFDSNGSLVINYQATLNGLLDDVRIYNIGLSQQQIEQVFVAGGGVLAPTSEAPVNNPVNNNPLPPVVAPVNSIQTDPNRVLPTELLPSDRLPPPGTWESAGVEGGIPDRQTIYANLKNAPYLASSSLQETTGSIAARSNQLTVASPIDFVVGHGINIEGEYEIASLQITSAATATSNLTITLNNSAVSVEVAAGDSAIQIADKIRATPGFIYNGWSMAGDGTDTVTFTALRKGDYANAIYSSGTTGVNAIVTTVKEGVADFLTTITAINDRVFTLRDNISATLSNHLVRHDDTNAIQTAVNSCPVGQVVFVPAGTYPIAGGIRIQKSITLRGEGSLTVFQVRGSTPISIGTLGPWPPPKTNASYLMPVIAGATRGSNTVTVANTSSIPIGKMVMIDEEDDPDLVWTKPVGYVGRHRASMHMVESKTPTTVTFRPVLPINYLRSPQISWYPNITQDAGVEKIKFAGTGLYPGTFINITSAWNIWVLGCEFTNMPAKTITAGWVGHLEIRKNYMHDQTNGGPNSEGLDLLNDANWSAIIDNICVAGGAPQINIGDGGPWAHYSGGFGNVIAYNYCVDAFGTTAPNDSGMMAGDISTNHSPHTQYNLIEGNFMNKFQADSYHGSGSHTLLFRNIATGKNRWTNAYSRSAIQIDRRNLYYSLIGNVLGEVGNPSTYEYATVSGQPSEQYSTIFRLGYPNVGNPNFTGTYPLTDLVHSDNGPRDLYADRNDTTYGTTIIEGNWTPQSGQSWRIAPKPIPNSYFLTSKPSWFGSLAWPPVDPAHPVTNDPTIIPAGYRYIHGIDPPVDNVVKLLGDVNSDGNVNLYDASLVAQYAIALPVANFNADVADVSGDGNVNLYDASLIAQYAVGLITKFPREQ